MIASAGRIPSYTALRLPSPLDWAALYGADRADLPRIVEIGFGRGTYLLHLAHSHPDHNILGLEVSNRCLEAAERAIGRLRLNHTRVVHGRAETVLHHLLPPASLHAVHINFPDPWFKTGHEHRRLMQRDTLDALASRLVPGGWLYLATDIVDYAIMSADLLETTPALVNRLPGRWSYTMPGRVTTKYEAKAAAEGRICHYFAYQRTDAPAPVVPLIEDLPMPHLVFRTPLTLDELHVAFTPIKQSEDDVHIHISESYRAGRHGSVLYELHLAEPTIDQHTVLAVTERQPGADAADLHEYTLQLTTFGHPRPTAGVHRAVRLLGAQLLGLHPAAYAVKHKLDGDT